MKEITPDRMCFGLSDQLDRESFRCFLRLAGGTQFSTTLAERITTDEIEEFVNSFTRLMKQHLSEHEYHTVFLQQNQNPRKQQD